MGRSAGGDDSTEAVLAALVSRLDSGEVAALLVRAALDHDGVAQAVRIAAAGDSERVQVLRAAVDQGLRTRRFLGYRESSGWAMEGRATVDALGVEVARGATRDLVVLLERAVAHVVKVILHADDSDGLIGDLARDLLELHAVACDAGAADPVALAKWMVRFTFDDQDFFVVDPVRYAPALGAIGIVAYRDEVSKRSRPAVSAERRDRRPFAESYAMERLAVLDRDIARLVELLGGDLTASHQFVRVAEAMIELGDDNSAFGWAQQGITETTGWQVAKLYDIATRILEQRGDVAEVVVLRRDQHHKMASASTYMHLKSAATTGGCWGEERTPARDVLQARDPGGYIDVLLADGDADQAWTDAVANPGWELGDVRSSRLAEAREPVDPADAMRVYLRLADTALTEADQRAYRSAVRHLQAACRAANNAQLTSTFDEHLAALRERHRRRPTLIALLDKAKLQ